MSMAASPNPSALTPENSSPRVSTGRQLGRYEILCELASGGMASVHIARAQGVAGFERLVAVKVLHPHLAHEEEFISMFLDEARLAARIRHPNVVATQDISDTEGNGYFLVMDYIEGDHLGSLLGKMARQGKAFPTPITARLLIDALTGLAAAHDLIDENGDPLNIVHRDISPHNILVGTDGVGRLTDFGVAKAEVRLSSTRAGQFKGKLSYMAPEQASTGNCDQRSDLFAMGIILWESLTARRLFRGESNAATLSKILVDPIPMPSEVSPDLAPWDAVLERALARSPDERFQTAHEFVEAIEQVAIAHGGIGTARAVAVMARELVGEKIENERARVRAAIAGNNGTSSGTQARIPLPSSATLPALRPLSSHSGIKPREGASFSGEMSSGGTVQFVQQEPSRKHSLVLVTALVLVAVAAGIAGFFANKAQTTRIERVVIAAPRTPAPAAEAAPTPPPANVVAPALTEPVAVGTQVAEPAEEAAPGTGSVGSTRNRPTPNMREPVGAMVTESQPAMVEAVAETPVMTAPMVETSVTPIEDNPYNQ